MKLSPAQRASLKMKFGGFCAYCGCALGDRWHADHVEPIERVTEPVLLSSGNGYETTASGFTKYRATGEMRNGNNDGNNLLD